jgi:hypothetical protein
MRWIILLRAHFIFTTRAISTALQVRRSPLPTAQRAVIIQPRATPWVSFCPPPSGLKGRDTAFVKKLKSALLFPILLATAALPSATAADLAIRFTDKVEVLGLSVGDLRTLQRAQWPPSDWQRLLNVRVEDQNILAAIDNPAIAGAYTVQGKSLLFKPQFPFQPGVTYRAVYNSAILGAKNASAILSVTQRIDPLPVGPATVVSAIHPNASELPENILKFYLQFSAPMSGGHIYEHIHLLNDQGAEVELPFLEIDEELWDPAMTRLTLFLDPGRIKRGVKPLEEIGPAIVEGKSFTLKIDAAWKDAQGAPLKQPFEKKFRVTAPDRTPPDPARWKIESPKPKTRDALQITFDEPLDHAILQRALRISGPSGATVRGQVELSPDAKTWRFTPNAPWPSGAYELLVPAIIEDLAGNNIGKPFDVDLEQTPRPAANALVRVPFKIQ